jgi:hypothetical protein
MCSVSSTRYSLSSPEDLESADDEQAFTPTTGVGLVPTARAKPGCSPSHISTWRPCEGRKWRLRRRAGGGVCLVPAPRIAHPRVILAIEILSHHRTRYPEGAIRIVVAPTCSNQTC